jgi:hypothetical protein
MPYERHPDLATPSNRTVLWRYMDFARFIEMLESRTLWFVRVDQLDDPLEGTHTDAEIAGIRKHLVEGRAKALIDVFRSARSELYVNCWRSGSAESLAMWDLYGEGSGIVAVKSTVGHIREAAATYDKPVYISKVKYIDWNDAPGLDNVLVACSRKDISYQHESEVRVIICGPTGPLDTEPKLGIRLAIDPKRLITEVMVGPRERKWVVRLVDRVMKRYGLPQQVVASNRLAPRQ